MLVIPFSPNHIRQPWPSPPGLPTPHQGVAPSLATHRQNTLADPILVKHMVTVSRR